MKLLLVSLTVLSFSVSNLASQSKIIKKDDGYPDALPSDVRSGKWSQKDTEIWQDNGRWRRDGRGRSDVEYDWDHPRREHWEDRRERKSRGDRRGGDERRWDDNGNGRSDERRRGGGNDNRNDPNGRDDGRIGNGNDNILPPYPPSNPNPPHVIPPQSPPPTTPSYPDKHQPQQPNERDTIGSIVLPAPVITTLLPPLPIIIEPIRSRPAARPSTIDSYPEVVETEASYYGSSTVSITSAASYSPSSSVYGSTKATYSSAQALASYATANKKQTVPVYAANSTIYASTAIVTEAESTITTKVTGRYRAMSNAANNLAGSVSFTIILLSSIFLVALV